MSAADTGAAAMVIAAKLTAAANNFLMQCPLLVQALNYLRACVQIT
jgi:hypothetical protein